MFTTITYWSFEWQSWDAGESLPLLYPLFNVAHIFVYWEHESPISCCWIEHNGDWSVNHSRNLKCWISLFCVLLNSMAKQAEYSHIKMWAQYCLLTSTFAGNGTTQQFQIRYARSFRSIDLILYWKWEAKTSSCEVQQEKAIVTVCV